MFLLKNFDHQKYISIGKQPMVGFFNIEISSTINDVKKSTWKRVETSAKKELISNLFNEDGRVFITTDAGYEFCDNGINYNLLKASDKLYAAKLDLYFDPITHEGAYRIYNSERTKSLTIKNQEGVDLLCLKDHKRNEIADTWVTMPSL